MAKYVKDKLLKLNFNEKFLFKILIFSIRILLIFLGVAFLFSKTKTFEIIGFWILVIYSFYFLKFKKDPIKDLRYEDSENILDFFDDETKEILLDLIKEVEFLEDPKKAQVLLAIKLLNLKNIENILKRLGIDNKKMRKDFEEILKTVERFEDIDIRENIVNKILKNIEPILIKSYEISKNLNLKKITPESIFLALRIIGDLLVQEVLNKYSISPENLNSSIVMELYKLRVKKRYQIQSSFLFSPFRGRWLNRTWTSSPTPFLDKIGTDLTYLARKGELGILIGHKNELNQLLDKIKKEERLKMILVGREGSGRTTLIYHLAYLIVNDQVPEYYFDKRIIELDIARVYSLDPLYFSQNFLLILNEAIKARNVILFFPELHQSSEISQIWPLLYTYIRETNLSIISTTTDEGLSKLNALYNISSFFDVIRVEELDIDSAITLLTLEAIFYEKEYNVLIQPQAISRAVLLAKKFLSYKPLPGSARDLIKETIGFAKNLKEKIITEEMIGDVASRITGIPIKAPLETEKYLLENLESIIHQRLVDQDYAVKEVARVLRLYRSGIEKRKGPIGTFLFIGPTGVGKTELAKTLARVYFGGEEEIIRIDMVEFQSPDDIKKLIGSEDGKIFGILTEEVRKKPYSLILLDEFEKANQQVLNLFLPIFDEGYIKDGLGRLIDFTNTIIICTSNAFSDFIKEEIEKGKSIEDIAPILRDKLIEIFRIELLNRFSGIIFFKPLSKDDLLKITNIMIDELNGDLLKKFGFSIILNDRAIKKIIELGYDPVYGARPLKRAIEREIISRLSDLILKEEIKRGDKILVDFDKEFIFKKLEDENF
ncbi:MAG: AAA family ATPase [Minisyncoccia bacterium]